jgi:small-conductance mechanosensitive channel
MNMDEFLDILIIEWGSISIPMRGVVALVLVLLILFSLRKIITDYLLPLLFYYQEIKHTMRRRIRMLLSWLFLTLAVFGVLWSLNLDFDLIPGTLTNLKISTILKLALFIVSARILDNILSEVFDLAFKKDQNVKTIDDVAYDSQVKPNRTIQTAVYLLVLIFILRNFNWDVQLFNLQDGNFQFFLTDILFLILIFIFARLFSWVVTRILMVPYYKSRSVDVGTQYAINQLFTYIVFVVAFFFAIESLGVRFALIWGSAAALLVGVGLGLQQTFNDLTSGILLLFERTIEVGNVVDLKGTIGIVRKIGLRTSQVETRDNVIILVPNSKFIVDEVVNWSTFDDKARFQMDVGVAYGSDTQKIRDILISVAKENAFVLDQPSPTVNFVDFGDSSLDFTLHFWSRNFMFIERIKSDLRLEVDRVFREESVTIPFPQRDLWVQSLPNTD